MLIGERYRLNALHEYMHKKISSRLEEESIHLKNYLTVLDSLSPSKLMQKGYFRILKDNVLVSNITEIEKDDIVEILAHDGKAVAKIMSREYNTNYGL